MRRILAALAALVFLCAFSRPVQTVTSNAQEAYVQFIAKFWYGSNAYGHFSIINQNVLPWNATVPPTEVIPTKSNLWQYMEAANVLYTYCKTMPGSDPFQADSCARLSSEWFWVKSYWPSAGFSLCGAVGGQYVTTLDDADWVTRVLVEFYEVTGDTTALTYAKQVFDCMDLTTSGFADTTLGGIVSHYYDSGNVVSGSTTAGVATLTLSNVAITPAVGSTINITGVTPSAYNGTFTATAGSPTSVSYALGGSPGAVSVAGYYHSGNGKGFNSLNYILSKLLYYKFACVVEGGSCPTSLGYYNSAVTELTWTTSVLDRANNSNCPQSDHLFWASVNGQAVPALPSDPTSLFCARANTIAKGGSVVGLFADLSGAAANGFVYANTSTTSYKTEASAIVDSILAKELDTCGAFLNDRDARGDGFPAYDFLTYAYPYATNQAGIQAAFRETSFAITQNDRAATGGYGGDWCGPVQGVWYNAQFGSDQLEIAAQAVTMVIAAAKFR